MLETASYVGHADTKVTEKHYARLFDRPETDQRVREAQEFLGL